MEACKKKKKPLIILTGPTAVGKTALSIGLAKAVGGEIISADSMQVYKGMDVGTAKITSEEMDGVTHYLVDELEPWEEFNVVVFQRLCKKYMERIYSKGKIPIIVGGTGFYIQSVLYDIDFTENVCQRLLEKGVYALPVKPPVCSGINSRSALILRYAGLTEDEIRLGVTRLFAALS